MKLILTGTSGFIGSEVLSQALRHPSITSIVALSRKPIQNSDPKLKVLLIDDFEHYSPSALSELSGAEACIWYVFLFSPTCYHMTYTPQDHRCKIHRPRGHPKSHTELLPSRSIGLLSTPSHLRQSLSFRLRERHPRHTRPEEIRMAVSRIQKSSSTSPLSNLYFSIPTDVSFLGSS
jgi:hypothetical protein